MRVLLLILLAGILSSCARPPLEPLPLYPGLKEELLGTLRSGSESFQSLKSMTKMSLKTGARKMSLSQALVLQKPDKLRIDVLSPFGATYLRASSDGRELKLYILGEERFYAGPPSPENLQMLTRMPIRIEQMVDLLLYTVPLIEGASGVEVRGADGYTLLISDGEQRQELRFDAQKRLVASSWYLGETLLVEVTYGEFLSRDRFPTEVSIRQPLFETSMRAVYDAPKLNAAIDQRLFSIQPPAGLEVEPFPSRNEIDESP